MSNKSNQFNYEQTDIFQLLICCITALNLNQPISSTNFLVNQNNQLPTELDFINLDRLELIYYSINIKSTQIILSIVSEQIQVNYFQVKICNSRCLDNIRLTQQYFKRFNYIYNHIGCVSCKKKNYNKISMEETNIFAIQAILYLNGI